MQQLCVIFLHLPKTGGVTLRHVFELRYRKADVMHFQSLTRPLEDFGQIKLARRQRVRAITGHFHYGMHRYIPRPSEYVTFLREPVARVHSMYRYIMNHPRHWLHEEVKTGKMTFEQFVESCADPGIDNHQTRLLWGEGSAHVGPSDPLPPLPEEAPAEAIEHLKGFLVVGLTETFDESFILLSRALGWKLPFYVTGNVSKRPRNDGTREVIDASDVDELIRERNRYDIELYKHARRLNAAAIEDHGESLQRELATFKVLNRIPNKVVPPAKKAIRRLMPSRFPGR